MKAFVVQDQDNLGIIVFHKLANKAKYFALKEYDFFECNEYIDLRAHICKEADCLATADPSILDFCSNSEVYKKLGWYCSETTYCDNEKCVMKFDLE